jgi:hypothetical protein
MLRLLVAVMLVSCGLPASVIATPSLAPSGTRALTSAPPSPTAAARPSPTPDPASLGKCAAAQLQAVAAGLMASDSFRGAVFIANRGAAPCTLRGNPELVLLAKDGSPLDVRLASVSAAAPAAFVVVPVSEFRPNDAGLMGAGATAPLQWSNYCDDVLPTSFRLTLPDAGGVIEGAFVDLAGRPVAALATARCDDASGPSTLVMYPFQEPVR